MKIKLPKELRAFAYDRVMPIEFNSFDVDLLLPSLFFKVITGGQGWGRRPNDPTKIREFSDKLACHDDLEGFDDESHRRLMERLVRTSLIQTGFKGNSRTVQQIEGIKPYNLLAFKPEFPSEHSRLRRADALFYRMLRDQMRSDDALRALFEQVFGQGVVIRSGAEPDGWYDGKTELSTLSRISTAFIDGFAKAGVRAAKSRPHREVCPGVADRIARDLRRYLETYRGLMSIESMTYHFTALLGMHLFFYTLKLVYATVELVDQPTVLPSAMQRGVTPTAPSVYLDFSDSVIGYSRQMSSSSVRRDLETFQRFIYANITLRQLDRYAQRLRSDRRIGRLVSEALPEDTGPEYLQALLGLAEDPQVSLRIDVSAQQDEEVVRSANLTSEQGEDENREAFDELISSITAAARSDSEAVALLITEGISGPVSFNLIKWYRSVGGLEKPYGILSGTLKSRQSWRYAPSNDFLATLVQLAAVDIPKWDKDDPRPQSIGLREFLDWLYLRFGILVDRPPEGFAGADYVAAAQENLRAMLRRLRQMGVFRDLSDDFTVQRLTPPYVDDERVTA